MGRVVINNWGFYVIYTLVQIGLVFTIFLILWDKQVRPGSFQEKLRKGLLYWTGIVIVVLAFDFGRSTVNAYGILMSIPFSLWYMESGLTLGYYIVMTVVFSYWKQLWNEGVINDERKN